MKNNKTTVLIIFIVLAAVLTAVSVLAFVAASTLASPTTNEYPNGMMGNSLSGMSGMMGENWNTSSTLQTSAAPQNTVLPFIGIVTLIGTALTGVGGVVYFLKAPKIGMAEPTVISTVSSLSQAAVTPYESVSKTLTAEERTVLDILVSHEGKYLQKYIRTETGLSRLKTHRIVSRLAERGIVTLEKSGNTNEIRISNWLNEKPFSKISSKEKVEQEIVVHA